MLVYSGIFFVLGAAAIQECISGTRVRERGIEMFCVDPPVVAGRRQGLARPRGRVCAPSVHPLPPAVFGHAAHTGCEIIVPVPASERPALEVFLAGHTATAG